MARPTLARVQRTTFGTPDELVHETLAFLRREGTVTSGRLDPMVLLQDPDDIPVLGEALASDPDVLVTGDRDLLEVTEEAPLPIPTPRAFWDRLRAEG